MINKVKCTPVWMGRKRLIDLVNLFTTKKMFGEDSGGRQYDLRPLESLENQYKTITITTLNKKNVEIFPVQFRWQVRKTEEDRIRFEDFYAVVLFFEKADSVYAIFKCGNQGGINKFKKLIGQEFKKAIIYPNQFRVTDDFYKWLLYYYSNQKNINKLIKIKMLSDYHGNLSDNKNSINGKGEDVVKLFASKATLFSTENLRSLNMTIIHENNRCNFLLNCEGETTLYINKYAGDFFNIESTREKEYLAVYYTFYNILFDLKFAHENDSSWTPKQKEAFNRQLGHELLRNIVSNLEIDKTKTVGEVVDSDYLVKMK